MNLEANLDRMFNCALKRLKEYGQVDGMTVLSSAKGDMFMPIIYKTDRERCLYLEFIREMVKRKDIEEVFVVSEAWTVTEDIRIPGVKPSDHACKKEVLMVTAQNPSQGFTRVAPIERDDEGKATGVGKVQTMNSLQGAMSYFDQVVH